MIPDLGRLSAHLWRASLPTWQLSKLEIGIDGHYS